MLQGVSAGVGSIRRLPNTQGGYSASDIASDDWTNVDPDDFVDQDTGTTVASNAQLCMLTVYNEGSVAIYVAFGAAGVTFGAPDTISAQLVPPGKHRVFDTYPYKGPTRRIGLRTYEPNVGITGETWQSAVRVYGGFFAT